MSQYFPPYNNSSEDIKVELDLTNYATKDDAKNITHVDVSSYATKTNLADITKLKSVDTSNFVTKTKFTADVNVLDNKIDGVERKIPDASG